MTSVAPLTATALVSFDDAGAADYSMQAQLDDRADGLNAGRTQFDSRSTLQAEWPAFLVWAALGSKGKVDVQAFGGAVVVVASTPAITTPHEQVITQHIPAGQKSTVVSLSMPSIGVPTFSSGSNVTVVPAKSTTDGWVTSVTLSLSAAAPAPFGSWIVGKLVWSSRARAYRIQPTVGAEQAVLLAVGLPAE